MKTSKRSAKPPTRGRFDLIERKHPHRRLISFPSVEGKIAKEVRLYTSGGYHSITLEFQDKTTLHFGLEPGITFYADYNNVKTGNVRVLKRWPPIPSQSLRFPLEVSRQARTGNGSPRRRPAVPGCPG